jgi:hypothetical protein
MIDFRKLPRRRASATASSIDGASTSIVLGVVFGSRMRSRSVSTDSTLALFSSSGLKSKRSQRNERGAQDSDADCSRDDRTAFPIQKAIERSERAIANREPLSARVHERDQRAATT